MALNPTVLEVNRRYVEPEIWGLVVTPIGAAEAISMSSLGKMCSGR